MNAQKKASAMSLEEQVLRYDVARIIYDADWISDHVRDIDEHYMVDEDDVVEAIIAVVREADR